MPPVRFPRTVRGRVAAGTGMAAVGGYGVQVGRAGRAEYAQRNFTNEDSREYNRAADQWVAAGKGKGKRFKAKYYNQSRRQFVRDNPRSKLVRPTVRRWEDRFANVQRMRQAPKGTPSAGEILLHPVKSRHRSDAAIMRRLVAGGSSNGRVPGDAVGQETIGAFRQRPLSSWTPHRTSPILSCASTEGTRSTRWARCWPISPGPVSLCARVCGASERAVGESVPVEPVRERRRAGQCTPGSSWAAGGEGRTVAFVAVGVVRVAVRLTTCPTLHVLVSRACRPMP